MANIEINQLKSEKETDEMIDLKAKNKKGSLEFEAFTTVRGGMYMAAAKWSSSLSSTN